MGQAYSTAFARLYDRRWSGFARRLAPRMRAFYEAQPAHGGARTLLDLGCGTGILAYDFLEAGYEVTGLDLSAAMLAHARARCAPFVAAGQATFVQGNAAAFALAGRYGLVAATYDMLNHLPDLATLRRTFSCVRRVLAPGGLFIFDLNTRRNLRETWPSMHVDDEEDLFLLYRGLFDEDLDRAYTSITGFVRSDDGRFERVRQVAYNTAFDLAQVRAALQEAGWPAPYAAAPEALGTPLDNPEAASRVFFVARVA